MGKIITIANQKGGVGKTTVSMALVSSLTRRHFRALGVDMDPQGSLGFHAGLDIDSDRTIYQVLKGETPIRDAIAHSQWGDFILSNILLSSLSEEVHGGGREQLLSKALGEVRDEYDFIVIDTPPGLNVLTTNAYIAADFLIIPTKPNILEVLAVAQLRDAVKEIQRTVNPDLKVLGILINFYNRRLSLGRDVMELMDTLSKEMDTRVFKAKISDSIGVAEAPAHAESIFTYKRAVDAKVGFNSFTNEFLQLMEQSR